MRCSSALGQTFVGVAKHSFDTPVKGEQHMAKTIAEINAKIRKGQAVVVNAEEIIDIVEEEGPQKAAETVDVVTTGTFGPMCSSGVLFNIPHTKPKIRIQKLWLNNINAYAGLAAVDFYLGVTEIPENDPANQIFPGEFRYGGRTCY